MKKIQKIDFFKVAEKVLLAVLTIAPFTAFADLPAPSCGLLHGVNCTGVSGPNDLIITVINFLLGIAAIVAVLYIVIGGFRYIMSQGNEKTAHDARNMIINALIGLAVIILAYVLVQVVNRATSTAGSSLG